MPQRGFTIVELLVVIVVIAILATISILADNGIQKRAGTAAYTSAMDGPEKQLRMASTDGAIGNTIPLGVCLGEESDFPATPDLPAGACHVDKATDGSYTKYFYVDPTVTAHLKATGVTFPKNLPTSHGTANLFGGSTPGVSLTAERPYDRGRRASSRSGRRSAVQGALQHGPPHPRRTVQ